MERPAERRSVHVEHVMGTVVSLDLRGDGDHTRAISDAVSWFAEVDRRFSPFRADSETAAFGTGRITRRTASADLTTVLDACDAIESATGGAFSATAFSTTSFSTAQRGRFDPSAFVKGWSVDRAGDLVRELGCTDWAINAGGDVLVSGEPQPGRAWRTGVRSPFDATAVIAIVTGGPAVATSGRYERGDHLLDGRTGRAADAFASVTVIGPELGLADAYSTAVFALGTRGPAWLASIPGYDCLAIADDGSAVATSGFPRTVHDVPVSASAVTEPWLAA